MTSNARGLLLDYGGVLTGPVGASFAVWEHRHGLAPGTVYRTLLAASDGEDGGIIGALERGELSDSAFEDGLCELLRDVGHDVARGAILLGLFEAMVPAGSLWDAVRAARTHGVRTGLVSNSWGLSAYPRDRLEAHFDLTVISGEVGLRKPQPAIFHLAVERLGLAPQDCAFVDDNQPNVAVAEQLGMCAVLHEGDDDRTREVLEDFLQVPLTMPETS